MAEEIEHKYLVRTGLWSPKSDGVAFTQGYLSTDPERIVRVRIAGRKAFLTIKGRPKGLTRAEYEYEIPLADAERMLGEMCFGRLIEKTRYREPVGSHVWEIDVFHGENNGLVLAELEVFDERETFTRPNWLGTDVSYDERYSNANLSLRPIARWPR